MIRATASGASAGAWWATSSRTTSRPWTTPSAICCEHRRRTGRVLGAGDRDHRCRDLTEAVADVEGPQGTARCDVSLVGGVAEGVQQGRGASRLSLEEALAEPAFGGRRHQGRGARGLHLGDAGVPHLLVADAGAGAAQDGPEHPVGGVEEELQPDLASDRVAGIDEGPVDDLEHAGREVGHGEVRRCGAGVLAVARAAPRPRRRGRRRAARWSGPSRPRPRCRARVPRTRVVIGQPPRRRGVAAMRSGCTRRPSTRSAVWLVATAVRRTRIRRVSHSACQAPSARSSTWSAAQRCRVAVSRGVVRAARRIRTESTGLALCGMDDDPPPRPSESSPISGRLSSRTSRARCPQASVVATRASPARVIGRRWVCQEGTASSPSRSANRGRVLRRADGTADLDREGEACEVGQRLLQTGPPAGDLVAEGDRQRPLRERAADHGTRTVLLGQPHERDQRPREVLTDRSSRRPAAAA